MTEASTSPGFRVDRQLLLADLSRSRSPRGVAWLLWFLLLVFRNAIGYYLVVDLGLAAVEGDVGRALTLSDQGLWRNLFLPLAFGVTVATWQAWSARRLPHIEPDAMARRIEQEWTRLTGPGWTRRTLLRGVAMGTAIGVLVGSVLALRAVEVVGLPESPLLAILTFTGLSLLWTLPAAFLIRRLVLRWYGRLQRPDPGV